VSEPYDVIIIGLGAMGSSACYHLAQRGVRVLGLEQFDIPHAKGSSHGYSRMIRLAYYEHPDYVPLLRRAYELWDELEQRSGQKVLYRTGGIYMGPPDGEVVGGATGAARLHGLEHELLDPAALKRRFPQFHVPPHFAGLWEPQAGFLLSEKAVSVHVQQALRAGAEVHAHEEVIDWCDAGSSIIVRTNKAEYRAKHLLFCGGAWTSKLLANLGVKLEVTRQVLGWVWPKTPEVFELGKFPVWGIENEDQSLSYGFPMMDDFPGLKVARHGRGSAADPNTISREITPADEAEVHGILNRHLPSAAGPTLAIRICMYTNSPDSHFIVGQLPHHGRITIACGFSGHGFKFASVIGEVLADLATTGQTRHPIGFLSPRRFG
jgi:sarcosine oxidase